ncbi:unnamed protein product, partial [Phaeothamnion confervicola]
DLLFARLTRFFACNFDLSRCMLPPGAAPSARRRTNAEKRVHAALRKKGILLVAGPHRNGKQKAAPKDIAPDVASSTISTKNSPSKQAGPYSVLWFGSPWADVASEIEIDAAQRRVKAHRLDRLKEEHCMRA